MRLHHEPEHNRFVLHGDQGELLGEVVYEVAGDTLMLLRAEVPPERRGEGVGLVLVGKTLEMIRDDGHGPIQPVCPFIARFMVKNPEFHALRA